jgi:hypothetical protein
VQELFTDKELEDLVRRASSLSDLNPCLFDELKDKVTAGHMMCGSTHSPGRSGDTGGGRKNKQNTWRWLDGRRHRNGDS